MDELTREFGDEYVFAYADDIMVITRSRFSCQKAVNIINNWCQNNKMELNKKKSGILQLTRDIRNEWKIGEV